MSRPLVSCLCVTESRREFMPWLLWGFDRQTYPNKELVIIDSSELPFKTDRSDIRVIPARVGTNVPAKRNLALGAAQGSIVAWFDDDDWQHPERLQRLVHALRDDVPFVGCARSWFVDLHSEGCLPYSGHRNIIFNGAGFQADLARAIRFDERIRKASDTVWMREFRARHKTKGERLPFDVILTLWLCHDANISNPRTRRRFNTPIHDLRDSMGAAWEGTDQELAELRERLPPSVEALAPWVRSQGGRVATPAEASRHAYRLRGRAHRLYSRLGTSVFQAEADADAAPPAPERPRKIVRPRRPASAVPRPAPSAKPARSAEAPKRPAGPPLPEVSLVVRAAADDVADLDVFVRHLQGQAGQPWVERIVVLENSGEIAEAAAVTESLERLVASRTIDRVLRAPASVLSGSTARYLRDAPDPMPLSSRATAELWGIAEASSEHVLLTSTRMFFYSGSSSWVADALGHMRADDRLWLMTTHAGPPSGAVGTVRSLSREEKGPLSWDRRLGLWRSRRALSEYFLLDRRKILGALLPQDPTPACLADWITTAMAKAGGNRGSLDGRRSWAVHARGTLPLSDWPLRVTQLVERGQFPACQRGRFHLDLQNARLEYAWRQLAENLPPAISARL